MPPKATKTANSKKQKVSLTCNFCNADCSKDEEKPEKCECCGDLLCYDCSEKYRRCAINNNCDFICEPCCMKDGIYCYKDQAWICKSCSSHHGRQCYCSQSYQPKAKANDKCDLCHKKRPLNQCEECRHYICDGCVGLTEEVGVERRNSYLCQPCTPDDCECECGEDSDCECDCYKQRGKGHDAYDDFDIDYYEPSYYSCGAYGRY